MDRRDFFKKIFTTSLLAPILLASESSENDELFLIADRPEIYLPELLKELGMGNSVLGQSYTFLTAHPQAKALMHDLKRFGWMQAPRPKKADLKISFRPLRHPVAPSFTLVRSGQIWDVRKKELLSLWREMQKKRPPSSCLTIAATQTRQSGNMSGDSVRIYMDGNVKDESSLKKDQIRSFRLKQGKITIKIEQGKLSVLSSPCRHKICCSVPPVSFTGERIVCAPNHFLLEIQGAGSIDTIIG